FVSALAALHGRNITHRDVKLENILLTTQPTAPLADFGLARPFAPGELLSTRCGSEEYAAPEMVMGGRYEPSGVDIWAAGVVLFALLTSHLPFTLPPNARPKVLYSKICRADFRFPDDLPSSASHGHLVRKMLQPDPRRRINWAGVRSHPWMAGV
ncbi:Pkinase-domain-containing protein, partial [Gonapodya prolifera JEL478]